MKKKLNQISVKRYGKKTKNLSLLMWFIITSSFAQEYYFTEVLQETHNFYEIQEKVEKYYQNRDKGKGTGYKQWKRWQHFYKNRIMSDGTIPNIAALEAEEIKKNKLFSQKTSNANTKSNVAGNWTNVALDSYERFGGGYNGGLGRVNCVAVDPANSNIIYVGTPAGGLWRSTTGGNSWEPLTDDLPSMGVSGIVIDYNSPVNNRTIYILTGDGDGFNTYSIGVLKSVDNGSSWTSTGLSYDVTDYENGYKLVMNPDDSDVLMVAMRGGIYRSTDAGATWDFVLNSWRVYDIEFKPNNPSTVYAAANGYVYKSTNGGASWSTVSGIPYFSSRSAIAVTAADPEYVYLLTGRVSNYGEFSGLYRSTDSGNSFTLQSDTPNILGYSRFGSDDDSQSWYDLALAVSPTDRNEVHAGGINCWKSSDGGQNWDNTSYWVESSVSASEYTHADIHALEYIDNTIYVGSDGGIYKTENEADSWESIGNGLNIAQPYKIGLDPIDAERFVFGSQDNGSNKFENGTLYHWFGADGFESIIDPNNTNRIYGLYQNGVLFKSENSGLSVSFITPTSENGTRLGGPWSTAYTLDPENSNVIYGGWEGQVYKSTDRGSSWENITDGAIGFSDCQHIALAPSNNDYIYVVKSGDFHYSHDGGNTWTENDFSAYGLNYVAVHNENPEILWVTAGNFDEGEKVYKSTDGGQTFTNISGGLPNVPANCVAYQNGSNDAIYVGTDIGVFYRNNDLSDWQLFSDNFPNTIVSELEIQYVNNTIYAATFGRGVWVSDLYDSGDTIPNDCVTSSSTSWANNALENQDSEFETTFSVTPNTNNMDGVVGLSSKTVGTYSDMGVIVRFNRNGLIDVRNGDTYTFTTALNYYSGNTYNFRVVTNFDTKQYSVFVTPQGNNTEQLIAENFNFRTQQANLANVNNWATFSGVGTLTACDFETRALENNENILPTVFMTSPADGAVFDDGSTITLSATASDSDGTVVRVTWYQNGIRILSDSGEPFSKLWENVPAGNYSITATAEDDSGGFTTSSPVNINVVTSGNSSSCYTSTTSFSGETLENTESGTFETSFLVTPNDNNMDGVIALADGQGSAYSDMAMLVRLNQSGVFDVRNGGNYSNSNAISYQAGQTYEVRISANINTKLYSVYVTSPGGTEVQVANNFNFRTDQANVSQINAWNWIAGVGSLEVCFTDLAEGASEIVSSEAAPEAEALDSLKKSGIENLTLSLIPNPAVNSVSFLFENNTNKQAEIYIIDASGKIVKQVKQRVINYETSVDISSLVNGVYFVKTIVEGKSKNSKLLVVK